MFNLRPMRIKVKGSFVSMWKLILGFKELSFEGWNEEHAVKFYKI